MSGVNVYSSLDRGKKRYRDSGPPCIGHTGAEPGKGREHCSCGYRIRGPNHKNGSHHQKRKR